jgi:hypothetical protein
MLKGSNKERLEQEIANLIILIGDGRKLFFKTTGYSLTSPDTFFNHFYTMELFQDKKRFIQLDLNIQLLYIKLSSYYQAVLPKKTTGIKTSRNAFSHYLTDLIFNKKVKYNFFLYKVSKNFKKVEYLFYSEESKNDEVLTKILTLDLDQDINDFLAIWSKSLI